MRKSGGLGDIMMMRMMFEDFKRHNPESELTFACPVTYHDVVRDHPYIDRVVDSKTVDLTEYTVSYDCSVACEKYETRVAPLSDKHRSDIWAERCGMTLTNHNMYLSVDEVATEQCRKKLETYREVQEGPIILFAPLSTMESRNLSPCQMNGVVEGLRSLGCVVVGSHHKTIKGLLAPALCPPSLLELVGFINAADYIVSVDTGTFHVAGGLDKPMVGIFSWADGKTRGKWFNRWILVQRHRDNGNWECGPCFLFDQCPKVPRSVLRKPCITEITSNEVVEAAKEMMERWPVDGIKK